MCSPTMAFKHLTNKVQRSEDMYVIGDPLFSMQNSGTFFWFSFGPLFQFMVSWSHYFGWEAKQNISAGGDCLMR